MFPLIHPLSPRFRHYSWGSFQALPGLLGQEATGAPVAEVWYGAHPGESSMAGAVALDQYIAENPRRALGKDVVERFGKRLPFLVKYIAPARPLSVQVHPTRQKAAQGFAEENQRGLPLDSPQRNYKDDNHKPEMLMALTKFEAVAGFRAPRKARQVLAGLEAPLAKKLYEILDYQLNARGIKRIANYLMDPYSRPHPEEVREVAKACTKRIAQGTTPSMRADSIAVSLEKEYPGDPGAVLSLLLNPVTLRPGETLFIPAGHIHAYISGMGIEIMANSDNVLRAGLTSKHVDASEMLRCTDFSAAPPMRIAPEWVDQNTRVFYAPVDDFELSLTDLTPDFSAIPGQGPRILTPTDGQVEIREGDATSILRRGQACFVDAGNCPLQVRGRGVLAQIDVP
ncbi:MAG: mannose-6-phosphate isomerase, class I [Actinomycetaceae bacterium]|nr:mannose-6-phosphate isomerase, class I [Actinomycetaceae bacterium]